MRADGLTTAKMLAITTALAFNRCLRNGGVKQENEEELIGSFKKKIREGISRAELIEGLNKLGFPEADYFIKKSRKALEFYNEEHKYIFDDKALEDDGTSTQNETAKETGFVGLGQLEAEERAEREKGEERTAAE